MKIAVTSTTADLTGSVPDVFSASPYLLIVDIDQQRLLHAEARGQGGDQALARLVLEWDCEGILCGPLEKEPFIIIADEACATRFNAAGLTVAEALARMESRQLDYIRDYLGGQGCGGDHPKPAGGCEGQDH